LKKSKWLGIPIPLIALLLVLTMVGGGVLGAFLFNQSIPSNIVILGGDVQAFSDVACTVPLTTLTFDPIRAGQTSPEKTFWVKNTGEDPVFCALAQSTLTVGLTLSNNGLTVPADPARLKLRTGTTDTATTSALTSAIDASITTIAFSNSQTNFAAGDIAKIGDELILLNNVTAGGTTDSVRGYAGSVAAPHAVGAPISKATVSYSLAPGAVLPVALKLAAGASVVRGAQAWQTVVEARDTPY